MTKEVKIKEAWGDAYDEVKGMIHSESGYILSVDRAHANLKLSVYGLELIYDEIGVRPKSLTGIEDNNGWIKIESEADLPKESGLYFVYNLVPDDVVFYSSNTIVDLENLKEIYEDGDITHYKPIEKPKPPVY